jgi:ribosomal protein S21
MCEKEGLIRDIKRNSYYEKPSEVNRRKRKKSQRMSRITSSARI